MTTETLKTVACPRCHKAYKVRSDAAAQVRCKNCGSVFAMGGAASAMKSTDQRDRRDQRTIIKVFVIGGVVLVLFAILFLWLGGKKSPVAPERPDAARRREAPPKPTSSIFDSASKAVSRPEQTYAVVVRFLEALGSGDREALEDLFLFDRYYEAIAFKYHWAEDDPRRYDRQTPEQQEETRQADIDSFLEAERTEYLKKFLIPLVRDKTLPPQTSEVAPDHASYEWLVKNEAGKPILNVKVHVRLRQGLEPETAGGRVEDWGVYKVEDLWHITTLNISKPDKFARDVLEERKLQREREARARAAKGPVEADPGPVEPEAGISANQTSLITQAIAIVCNRDAAGRELRDAQDRLKAMGKLAIPFLLNELVGKNHRDDEEDIFRSWQVVQILREITRESFGYGPTRGEGMALGGMTTATADERERAVRRWFGWWKVNAKTWTPPAPVADDPEEDEDKE